MERFLINMLNVQVTIFFLHLFPLLFLTLPST